MIDKDIVIKKLEDLTREIARIEFSHDFEPQSIEAAIKARMAVETLVFCLKRMEPEE